MTMTIDSDTIETELSRLRNVELTRDQIDTILVELGDHIGVDQLKLDENGVAELIVDDEVELSLVHLPTFPGIVAAVPMPEGSEESNEVLRRLLRTNMSWTMTQGGCFAIVPPRVALCRLVLLAEGQTEQLDNQLAMFVDLAKAWQEEIQSFLHEEPSIPPEKIEQEEPEDAVARIRV